MGKRLIYEEDAIDELVRWGKISDYSEKEKILIGAVIGMLSALPSAQPEDIARDIATIIENEKDMRVILDHQWIPVTEVMPDEHNRVLILTDDGTIFIGDHNEYWEDDYEFEIDDVIAWMPLPECYKGDEK